jgi:hypothetical protein
VKNVSEHCTTAFELEFRNKRLLGMRRDLKTLPQRRHLDKIWTENAYSNEAHDVPKEFLL